MVRTIYKSGGSGNVLRTVLENIFRALFLLSMAINLLHLSTLNVDLYHSIKGHSSNSLTLNKNSKIDCLLTTLQNNIVTPSSHTIVEITDLGNYMYTF